MQRRALSSEADFQPLSCSFPAIDFREYGCPGERRTLLHAIRDKQGPARNTVTQSQRLAMHIVLSPRRPASSSIPLMSPRNSRYQTCSPRKKKYRIFPHAAFRPRLLDRVSTGPPRPFLAPVRRRVREERPRHVGVNDGERDHLRRVAQPSGHATCCRVVSEGFSPRFLPESGSRSLPAFHAARRAGALQPSPVGVTVLRFDISVLSSSRKSSPDDAMTISRDEASSGRLALAAGARGGPDAARLDATPVEVALRRLEVGVTSGPLNDDRRVATHRHVREAGVSQVVEDADRTTERGHARRRRRLPHDPHGL